MKIIAIILAFATLAVAKDKPETKPTLTPDQKIAILTAERDYLAAQKAAIPYDVAAQQALNALQAKQAEVLKQSGIDPQKWRLDLMSLDFVTAPPELPHGPLGAPNAVEKK